MFSSMVVVPEPAVKCSSGRFEHDVVEAACGWLSRGTIDGSGVPFVLVSVADGPMCPGGFRVEAVRSTRPLGSSASFTRTPSIIRGPRPTNRRQDWSWIRQEVK